MCKPHFRDKMYIVTHYRIERESNDHRERKFSYKGNFFPTKHQALDFIRKNGKYFNRWGCQLPIEVYAIDNAPVMIGTGNCELGGSKVRYDKRIPKKVLDFLSDEDWPIDVWFTFLERGGVEKVLNDIQILNLNKRYNFSMSASQEHSKLRLVKQIDFRDVGYYD